MELLKRKVENNTLWKLLYGFTFLGETISGFWLIDIIQTLVNAVTESNMVIFNHSIEMFIIILIINVSFIIFDQYFLRSVTNYGEMNLKKYTFNNYLLNVASSENRNAGKFVSRINSDIPIISNWISVGRINTYLQIIYLIICLTIMFYYSIEISSIILLLIVLVFFMSRYFSIKESKSTKELQNSFETISDKIYNSFLNLKTIRQLGKQDYFTKKVKKLSLDNTEKQIDDLGKYKAFNEAMLEFMTDTLPLIAFFLAILMSSMGRLSMGTGLSLMLVAQKLNEPIIILAELISDKKNAEQVYERVQELYSEESTENGSNMDNIKPFQKFDIEIKKFGYEDSKDEILKDIGLIVEKGDLCVVEGESGRGKSTLLKVIANFLNLKEEQGVIKYNNENIRECDPQKYYQHVLLAEQNSVIIEGSLEENILLGDSYSQEQLEEAIYICKLNDFYEEKGENYVIKENGRNISGGEKQRINLARIILRNPEVLILDEVTSNIDKEIRKELISRLIDYKNRKAITLIAVSHNDDFDCYNPKKYIL